MKMGLRALRSRRLHYFSTATRLVSVPVGKTRLVLAALRPPDLALLVIYCDGPAKIRDSELLYALLKDDNPFSVILVVDECDADTRSTLWDELKHAGPRVKLVSIYGEFDDTTGNTTYLTAPPLDNERIIEILLEYLPAAESANRWAEFCSGSPPRGARREAKPKEQPGRSSEITVYGQSLGPLHLRR